MSALLDFLASYGVDSETGKKAIGFLFVISPIAAIFAFQTWRFRIRPLLIPKAEINRIVDDLIAKHGPDAESAAYQHEKNEWYESNTYEQGKWHRVRRELWRRYKRGEWQ